MASHTDFRGSHLYRCIQCSHVFCWPEPTFQELAEHYEKGYSTKRQTYFGDEYRDLMLRRSIAQVDLISLHARGGVAVDVGCGIGALVAQLAARGWDASGFDGDPAVVSYGRKSFGANITVDSMDAIQRSGAQVDLLCFSHVVEHFRDVVPTLTGMALALRPGGHLFAEVPNETSVPRGDMESHIQFFTAQSLADAMRRSGLEVVFCSACGPISHSVTDRPSGALARAIASLQFRVNRFRGKTPWDGWYDHYDPDGKGIWLRCIARRPTDSP